MSKEREALKLTLAALKQIDEAMPFPVAKLAIMKAEEVLEQPAPVLTGIDCSCGRKWRVVNNTLTASGPPEQEPVAWLSEGGNFSFEPWQGSTPLYTTPPQRTWVGLDNDDLVWIYSNSDKVGQAISNTEVKLKEKNT